MRKPTMHKGLVPKVVRIRKKDFAQMEAWLLYKASGKQMPAYLRAYNAGSQKIEARALSASVENLRSYLKG